jgi:sterol 14-demethylase
VIERGYREHGPVFTVRLLGGRATILVGGQHAKFFFSETDQRLSLRTAYPYFIRMFDPDFYFFAEFEEYKRQRALVLPRFQSRQLGAYIASMQEQTRALIEQLGTQGRFDLTPVFGPLVMRIAAQCFLGPEFAARLGDQWFREFRVFSGGMDPITPGWLPLPHIVNSRRARDRLRAILLAFLNERRGSPLDPPDFFQTLAEARFEDGTPVPDLVLVNLILMLTWAGHETTTGHVSWALVDLLQHPDDLQAVLEEQQRVLDPGEPLTAATIHRLTHLDGALHESERLHPVAPVLARCAAEDFEYAGYHIPRDSMLILSTALSHRRPETFPQPEEYRPDRYQQDPKARAELVGFGGGLHRCLGIHFAYLEMAVVLTMLLREFEFELTGPPPRAVPGQATKWPASPCLVNYQRKAKVPAHA